MMQVALRGLWGRKLRTVLTALSIVLGTSMITGTFILRDQINNAFSDIFHESNKGIDVVLSKKTAFTTDSGAVAGPLPESVIATAKTADGVEKAEGQIQATGSIVVDGKYVTGSGGAPNLVFSYVTEPFSNSQFTSGGPPDEGTVAINQKLANDEHLKVGDQVKLATDKGAVPVTISGIFKLAGVSSIGGATLVVPTFEDAQRWFDRIGKTSVVYLQAEPGVTPGGAKKSVQAAVPDDVKVQTGTENADEQTSQVEGSTSFITYVLLAFAGAAVFVGLFIIFNTFSITVAQRIREFAMLRTLGASRRQVLRSVLIEAALMGLVASMLGIGLGILLAIGLNALFKAAGVDLPDGRDLDPAGQRGAAAAGSRAGRGADRVDRPCVPRRPGCRRSRRCAKASCCRPAGWRRTCPYIGAGHGALGRRADRVRASAQAAAAAGSC